MSQPVFIVGTPHEAARIRALGHEATATGEMDAGAVAGYAMGLASEGRTAIILLDEGADQEFRAACVEAGAAARIVSDDVITDGIIRVLSGSSDATDADRASFAALLDSEESNATRDAEADRARAEREVLQRLGVHDVTDVALQIARGEADRTRIPTGLRTLDDAIGGGIPVGSLVTLGATSSTGKTTLVLQWADTIAASGRPVLFVTVEQGRHELVAKSLSRLMRSEPKRHGWYAVGAAEVQSGEARARWDVETCQAFNSACARYASTIAPNLYVMETDHQPGVSDIRRAAAAIRQQRGKSPVVAVDYLQLLAPQSDRQTDKQAVDANVMSLRHLARDMGTVVIAISSLNRSSYSTGVSQEAFKESGALEYGADLLLGMQPADLAEKVEAVSEAKQKGVARQVDREFKRRSIREVVVVILKNRGGAVYPDGIHLRYDAVSNLFTCDAPARPGEKATRKKRL